MRHIIQSLLFISFLSTTLVFGQQRTESPVEFHKISDRLYEITGGRGSNGGAYMGDNGVLLIDTKMDQASEEQVLEELRKMTDRPVRYLVNTHSDRDHINGNRYLPPTVTFIAHENCRKEFFIPGQNGTPSEWEQPELLSFTPSVTFNDQMEIHLGAQTVQLWYFGIGHTTGDIVVYFPEEKTAFIGDQIFLTRPQLIHSYKGGSSLEQVKTLTRMLATIDAVKFCSGHSEITDRAGIENHIALMKQKQQTVMDMIDQNKDLEQIKAAFEANENRLVESIYHEINQQKESTHARSEPVSYQICPHWQGGKERQQDLYHPGPEI